jgi:hypothetical protein
MRELFFYCELEDIYEELLNECYEPVNICGYEYDQGHALRQLDPVAFRCGVCDYESEQFEEIGFSEMTQEEREHYIASSKTTMYLRKEE